MGPPAGKKFYGSVTVSERGQVVIPADARKDFGIGTGEKLLVFGDMKTGLWIATLGILERNIEGGVELLRYVVSGEINPAGDKPEAAGLGKREARG
jgi:AbrB family looped-hinge helix DNA binding protein